MTGPCGRRGRVGGFGDGVSVAARPSVAPALLPAPCPSRRAYVPLHRESVRRGLTGLNVERKAKRLRRRPPRRGFPLIILSSAVTLRREQPGRMMKKRFPRKSEFLSIFRLIFHPLFPRRHRGTVFPGSGPEGSGHDPRSFAEPTMLRPHNFPTGRCYSFVPRHVLQTAHVH